MQIRKARLNLLGLAGEEKRKAIEFGRTLHNFGTSQIENVTAVTEGLSIFGKLKEAQMAVPIMQKIRFANSALRAMQKAGEVYMLIAANGDILGIFVIISIRETRTAYKKDGNARKLTFSLTLKRYADIANAAQSGNRTGTGLLGGIKNVVGKITDEVSGLEQQAIVPLKGVLDSADNALGKAVNGFVDDL